MLEHSADTELLQNFHRAPEILGQRIRKDIIRLKKV